MATFFSNTLVASNSTDAFFRAIVSFIHNSIIGGGWVQTADSGQINPATVLHPTVSAQKMGYGIYRMNDALQATAPVFIKIDYGAGGTINAPGIWVSIGTGSDGAGNLTGQFYAGGVANPTVNTGTINNVNATNSYMSVDPSRIQALLFVSQATFIWSLERGKQLSGADDPALLYMTHGHGTGGVGAIDTTMVLIRAGGGQPPAEVGGTVVLSNQTTSIFSSDVGIGMIVHFKGIAQPIGLGVIVVNSGDFLAEAQITMAVYGVNHTYQLGNVSSSTIFVPTGNGANTLRANTRLGIRYE